MLGPHCGTGLSCTGKLLAKIRTSRSNMVTIAFWMWQFQVSQLLFLASSLWNHHCSFFKNRSIALKRNHHHSKQPKISENHHLQRTGPDFCCGYQTLKTQTVSRRFHPIKLWASPWNALVPPDIQAVGVVLLQLNKKMILKSFLLTESIKMEGVFGFHSKMKTVTTGRPGPAPLLGGSATDEPRG